MRAQQDQKLGTYLCNVRLDSLKVKELLHQLKVVRDRVDHCHYELAAVDHMCCGLAQVEVGELGNTVPAIVNVSETAGIHLVSAHSGAYSVMLFVSATILSVTPSGAGPPLEMLYLPRTWSIRMKEHQHPHGAAKVAHLIPKSSFGPPGLWLAVRINPPRHFFLRINAETAGVERIPLVPTITRPTYAPRGESQRTAVNQPKLRAAQHETTGIPTVWRWEMGDRVTAKTTGVGTNPVGTRHLENGLRRFLHEVAPIAADHEGRARQRAFVVEWCLDGIERRLDKVFEIAAQTKPSNSSRWDRRCTPSARDGAGGGRGGSAWA